MIEKVNVNELLARELHKTVIKKFERRKMYAWFKDNIWAADLTDMGSWPFNCCVKYLLCVIDVFTKYVWVKSLMNKKVKSVLNGFIEIVNESKPKPNILRVDWGR